MAVATVLVHYSPFTRTALYQISSNSGMRYCSVIVTLFMHCIIPKCLPQHRYFFCVCSTGWIDKASCDWLQYVINECELASTGADKWAISHIQCLSFFTCFQLSITTNSTWNIFYGTRILSLSSRNNSSRRCLYRYLIFSVELI